MDVKDALGQLDPKNDEQWTADGLPLVDVMRNLTEDFELTRQQISEADPEFCREAVSASPGETPPSDPPGPVEKGNQLIISDLDNQIQELESEIILIEKQKAMLFQQRKYLQELQFRKHTPRNAMQQQLYWVQQQGKLRRQRAERSSTVVKALGVRAPIDQAMARKTRRGTQRPVRSTMA